MARPRLKRELLHDRTLNINLTEKQENAVKALAALADIPVQTMLRNMVAVQLDHMQVVNGVSVATHAHK